MERLSVDLSNSRPMPLAASFDCEAGELIALVGPSGSGKTSLLRAIAGLLSGASLSGQVRLGRQVWFDSGLDIDLSPQQRQVGMVFQHYALFPHLSAYDNVALAAGKGAQASVMLALLERLGMAAHAGRRPDTLSGGQQQRVALARALARVSATGSGVLLLDEPFSAVDAPTRQTLYEELARLRQGLSMPMVLVTHDLNEARRLADRVVILDAGTSLQTGTPERIFASPRNARVAELIGISNHFRGRFFKHQPGRGWLHWGEAGSALQLSVVDKNRLENGVAVSWVLAGESVDVLAPSEPGGSMSAPEPQGVDANLLSCKVVEVLALGEISLCTLIPLGLPEQRITLNLSGALLRQLGVAAGGRLTLRIPAAAVHIMPTRS